MIVELDAIHILLLQERVSERIRSCIDVIKEHKDMPQIVHFMEVEKAHFLEIQKRLNRYDSRINGTTATNDNDA